MVHYEDYLSKIYYDPNNPASFSDADELYRAARNEERFVLSHYKIQRWQEKQEIPRAEEKRNSNAMT